MKKKITILAIAFLAGAILTAVPIKSGTNPKSERIMENEALQEELSRLRNKAEVLERLDDDEAQEQYREIMTEITDIEIKCGEYDYKAEILGRLNTVEAAVSDMKRELEAGVVSGELKDNVENRIQIMEPLIEKYETIMEQAEEIDYKSVAGLLDKELDAAYDKMNSST